MIHLHWARSIFGTEPVPAIQGLVGRTDKGGAQWQFVYTEGALRRVSAELRYWPDRQTNPELVVPHEAGLKDAITQADAKA